ncbi:hypothetical protein [Ilumatobacter nonamiensis]|uniref:hypothetical protein n=1 Tax=Ilumatobacter nonamiensis TaxID=467093 RepID=UPI00034AF73D|nr:hypothetical protein [Ilumatobacter nonamiensis]
MVVINRPFEFRDDDPRPMMRHLDAWARRSLNSPEAWASMLERAEVWIDYSARNQVLLASYGIVGPVAGAATWGRVPSSEGGRACAVGAGEHGLPVRVPVVGEPTTVAGRSRSLGESGSVASGHRWELVFAEEQLARRPARDAVKAVSIPRMSDARWSEAVRVATGRMVGRTPRRVQDPLAQLVDLARHVPPGAGRVGLDGVLAEQAGLLAAGRVGRATEPLPVLDPNGLTGRERWRTLVDVRHAAGRVVDALSYGLEVDLSRSPLPRHELADDRQVASGRRNYLSPADVRSLPLGVWIEVGPYSKGEWLARGIAGANGVGAFMRVNDRSYLAAYETRAGAMWRLETTGRGAHLGLVGEGAADDLAEAKRDVRAALRDRFPDVAVGVETSDRAKVLSPSFGWVSLPTGRDERTEQREFDERVSARVHPGPGGRWEAWVSVDGQQRQGPLTENASAAREIAEGLAHGALIELASVAPDRANAMVTEAAGSGSWDRGMLASIVGHRLTDSDALELGTTSDPARLTELVKSAGVLAPATMLRVLHAEDVPLDTVIDLVPALGLPIGDAIRQMHSEWGANRLEVGMALGATVEELRDGGCSRIEMLAASPREELRHLDTREQTWQSVGPTLLEAGYSEAEAIKHLAAHAPTPSTFAVAAEAVVDDPCRAFALSVRHAQTDDLAHLAERFGMSPAESATVLGAVGAPPSVAVQVIEVLCEHDRDATCDVAGRYLGIGRDETEMRLDGIDPDVVVPLAVGTGDRQMAALRRSLGPPDHSSSISLDAESIRAALDQVEPAQPADRSDVEADRVP